MSSEGKEFEPIIKKTTSLHEKKVTIQGSNDFGRSSNSSVETNGFKPIINPPDSSNIEQPKKVEVSKPLVQDKSPDQDQRYKAKTTQKISASTNLKINLLKPFLKDFEDIHKGTFNDVVVLLADYYVQSKMTTRQLEAYKSMYETQFDMLDK